MIRTKGNFSGVWNMDESDSRSSSRCNHGNVIKHLLPLIEEVDNQPSLTPNMSHFSP